MGKIAEILQNTLLVLKWNIFLPILYSVQVVGRGRLVSIQPLHCATELEKRINKIKEKKNLNFKKFHFVGSWKRKILETFATFFSWFSKVTFLIKRDFTNNVGLLCRSTFQRFETFKPANV